MTIAAVADTHTAIWHLFGDPRLSATAAAFIEEAAAARHKIAISTISLAELVYLVEKGRLPEAAYTELAQALADPEHVLPRPLLPPPSSKRCGKSHVQKSQIFQTASLPPPEFISVFPSSAATASFAPPA